MNEKEKIGGRAYKNGLRLMNNRYSVKAYYDKNDNLKVEMSKVKKSKYYKYLKKIPVLRGIFSLLMALYMFLKEVFDSPKKYWFILLILFLDLFIIFLPDSGGEKVQMLQGLVSILYIALPLILLFIYRNGISEVLKFHGAEHKAVHYYENNYEGDIASYSRIHRRCGSNIVFYYLIISFLSGFLNINFHFLIQELLFLGLAYEAIKYTPEKLLFFPSLFQRLVTREPDQRQLKAAQTALDVLTNK